MVFCFLGKAEDWLIFLEDDVVADDEAEDDFPNKRDKSSSACGALVRWVVVSPRLTRRRSATCWTISALGVTSPSVVELAELVEAVACGCGVCSGSAKLLVRTEKSKATACT